MKSLYQRIDDAALAAALNVHERAHAIKCSGFTQTYGEYFFSNRQDFTAYASSASEGSLISGGGNEQPKIPAFLLDGNQAWGKVIEIEAEGILGSTGTPTYTFQVRLGTTQGASDLTGTSVGVSAAITAGNGVSNKWWMLRMFLHVNTPGLGTGNCTLNCNGYVMSPTGFASPLIYPLLPTTPDTATWTATINAGLTQYINLSVTSSASSASNTLTCKALRCKAS